MILWAPIILLRAFFFSGNNVIIDGLLLLAAVICITTSDYEFTIVASLQNIPLYFLLGIIVFLFSVLATVQVPFAYLKETWILIVRSGSKRILHVGWGALLIAMLEEVVWRVTLQTVLAIGIGVLWALLIVAIAFSILHLPRTDGVNNQLMELFVFSLILGILFAITRDIIGIIVVHTVRNFLITIRGTYNEA